MSPPYVPVSPAQLPAWLDDDGLLILDVRPSAAFNSARLPRALSLAVPTTLLKRPLFSLDRLAAMLSNADTRSRFANWSSASRILVYDADSTLLPDSSIINALLKKFRTEGFARDLAWILGGFQAILREATTIIDTHPFDSRADEEENDASCLSTHSVLRPNRLPMAAFTISSTILSSYDMAPALQQKNKPPGPLTVHSGVEIPRARPPCNPFFDVVRQNIELSHGITERIPLYLPRRVHRRIHELPFHWLQDIAQRAAPRPRLDELFTDRSDSEGEQNIDPAVVAQGAEMFAAQFHRIELAEQRRLMSVLERHARESGKDGIAGNESFPFSITAGIEKGEKNRYRHIWPFEHARVRLHHKRDSDDDYVNASYVQPLGTKRRYIATQGPLPATFQDFWMLCWEQNVHVIVMLTREVEGSMVKCGAYWTDTLFGPLRLRLISSTGQTPTNNMDNTAGYFAPQPPVTSPMEKRSPDGLVKASRRPTTIKRVFELTNANYPHVKPRRVVHFQYLEWLDMTVPDDPRGVLELVREVDKAVQEAQEADETSDEGDEEDDTDMLPDEIFHAELDARTGTAKCAKGKNTPVLLHCSAGVGRTGGFIAVDAVLDAIRREMGRSSHRRQPRRAKPTSHGLRHSAELKTVRQVDGNMLMSECGGSSSSSALPACSDSSSSDDSFEFDRNARASGKHQSACSSPPSPFTAITVRSSAKNPVLELTSPNGIPKPNFTISPPSNPVTHGSRGFKFSFPSRQAFNSSDEGEFPSRSISPSADESKPNALQGRPRGRSMIPSALNLTPVSSPPSYNEAKVRLKEPRRLHDDKSPIELGTFGEPIWEVVQDMREQRMSLCQSLRQYVFVHAAVIEGALMIVDEERQHEKLNSQMASWQPTSLTSPKIYCKPSPDPTPKGNQIRPVGLSVRSNGLTSAILTGKRVASPTELPKENKQGQVQLSKRPSLQKTKSP